MTHGSLVTVLHRSYYVQDLSIENKKAGKQKHVVVSGKQQIIGVDGVLDHEYFNLFNEMPLFTDLPEKIINVDRSIQQIHCPICAPMDMQEQ